MEPIHLPHSIQRIKALNSSKALQIFNPQITFFKVVYRRHTNFAIEAIQQTATGSNSLGSRATFQITRNGDLIHRVYFYGKIKNTHASKNAAMVPNFGQKLLKTIELEIGGQRIDKHYSEWLYIWNELSLPYDKREGYNVMVGANKENTCTKLSAGKSYELYVPLEFWFCRNVGLALPLIALQYHEVKINIEYESDTKLYDTGTNNFCYKSATANSDASFESPTLVLEEPTLWVDYIFLDTDERRRFAQLSHEYLIEQLQFTGAESVTNLTDVATNVVQVKPKLSFNHPCKELVWFATSDFTTGTKNNNWMNYGTTVNSYDTVDTGVEFNSSSAVLSTNPVKSAKLVLNGNDRFSERPGSYFNLIQPYQHHGCIPANPGINVYSFALKPEEHQPSGTLNMSRIDTAVLNLSLTGLRSSLNGAVNLHVYAVNYNVLRILSGMGGLAYSN